MIWTFLHYVFVIICGIFLVLVIALTVPLGIANSSKHHPTCCCDYCDPRGIKARRLGIKRH
jgi:hypothetical protein